MIIQNAQSVIWAGWSDLRISRLQSGCFRKPLSSTPEPCMSLVLRSRNLRWEGLDFRAEVRRSQLVTDNLQPTNLKEQTVEIKMYLYPAPWVFTSLWISWYTLSISGNQGLTWELPACSLDSSVQHRAAPFLNPAARHVSGSALWGWRGLTPELRPRLRSDCLRGSY